MSEMFSDEDQSPPEPSQSDKDTAYWKAEAEKAFRARDDARQELRTTIQAGYDPEVAELVPKDLPPTEWKAYADRLIAFRGNTPNPTEKAEAEAPQEAEAPAEQLQAEQRLATVAGQAPGTPAAQPGEMSGKDLMDLYKSDPAEATRRAIAKYQTANR